MNAAETQVLESAQSNETQTPENETVSQGDAQISETVSHGDAYTTIPYDDTPILDRMDIINNLLVTIIFLILFIWTESRLRNAVWRFFGHGKSN